MNLTLSLVLSRRGLRSNPYRLLFTIFMAVLLIACAGWQHSAQAATLTVPSTQYPTLQSAINAAQYGDTIIVQAGMTFQTPNGPFVLPYKPGGTGTDADYITIQSSALSNLPAGMRVGPGTTASMPKLETRNYTGGFSYGPPVIITEAGAHHYKLIGLEITADPTTGLSDKDLIAFGDGSSAQNSLTQVPHHIVLDRCYVHVGSMHPAKRGIALNSKDTFIINSYIAGFKLVGVDSQAIAMWNGPGPYLISNNYLEGAAENVIIIGGHNSIPNLTVSDVEIRGNLLSKPLSWKPGHSTYGGIQWSVKNLLELKAGKRVTVDGNIFEYCWQGGQDGNAIGINPLNPVGAGTTAVVEDFVFTNNIVRHAAGGIALAGRNDQGDPNSHTWRVTIRNNLFVDINGSWGETYGRLFMVNNYTDQVTIEHNTGINSGSAVHSYLVGNTNFVSRNNIFWHDVNTGGNPGDEPLNANFPGAIWKKNVQIAGGPASYYAGTNHTPNYFPANESEVGFVNYAGGDYHLASTSQYKNFGSDGKDIGADIDALNAATGGVMSGLSPTPYGGTPAAVPGTLQVENFDNGGEGVAYHDQDSGNNGGVYRTTDVDIRAMTGASNGYDVFNARAGEWLKYTINVPTSGTYDIKARVASRLAGGTFHFEVDNVDVTGSITAPTTGSWSVFQDAGKSGISLTAGTHVLRLALDTNGVEGIVADLDTIIITQSSQGFSDDFNDNTRDATKWNVGELYSGYVNDPQVTVLEQNQQLEITPISGTTGHHHNGYVSVATWNMTGAQARVEVKRVASYSASTVFYIGSDSNNGYLIIENDGQMFFKTKIAGVENYPTPIPYNSVQHRFWRFRHDPAIDQIKFETSADGTTWTVRRTVQRQITITALRVELDAGTYAAEWNMGSSIFDNFQLITP
jgi:hypothetical protein